MPDEVTPAPEVKEDTPVATPEAPESPDTPKADTPDDTDYKQRYEDLRPEFDRRNELLADIEGRNGPERQAAALAEHARIELEDEEAEEDEDEFDLPPDPSEEIAAIKQELAERDQAAEEAQFDQLEEQYTEETINSLQEEKGIELSAEERSLVENYGFAHRDPHDGKPDFEGGLKALEAGWEAARKRYEASKTDAALAPLGSSGEPKIDLRDKEARQKLGREVFEAAERSKET